MTVMLNSVIKNVEGKGLRDVLRLACDEMEARLTNEGGSFARVEIEYRPERTITLMILSHHAGTHLTAVPEEDGATICCDDPHPFVTFDPRGVQCASCRAVFSPFTAPPLK